MPTVQRLKSWLLEEDADPQKVLRILLANSSAHKILDALCDLVTNDGLESLLIAMRDKIVKLERSMATAARAKKRQSASSPAPQVPVQDGKGEDVPRVNVDLRMREHFLDRFAARTGAARPTDGTGNLKKSIRDASSPKKVDKEEQSVPSAKPPMSGTLEERNRYVERLSQKFGGAPGGKIAVTSATTDVLEDVRGGVGAEASKPTTESIAKVLPAGPRICILGGTKFEGPETEALVTAIAGRMARVLAGRVVVLTGGMPGVQAAFAKGFGASQSLVHLLPDGRSSGFGVGRDMRCGSTLEDRMEVFGQLGQVYLTFEGGPGVAKEAKAAFERGAVVLPMISTGGASGGMFDFPKGALHRPGVASEEQWACFTEKVLPDQTAVAVIDVILAGVESARSVEMGAALCKELVSRDAYVKRRGQKFNSLGSIPSPLAVH